VLLAKISDGTLAIDTWLMSCRVLKRGVEQFLLGHLIGIAKERSLGTIRGEYVPTAKNGLVRDHYLNLGFALIDRDDSGRTVWELHVDEGLNSPVTFIKESRADVAHDH
jgi:predicted enzyme involved in methoxymalonyl-ACP biosynthesis